MWAPLFGNCFRHVSTPRLGGEMLTCVIPAQQMVTQLQRNVKEVDEFDDASDSDFTGASGEQKFEAPDAPVRNAKWTPAAVRTARPPSSPDQPNQTKYRTATPPQAGYVGLRVTDAPPHAVVEVTDLVDVNFVRHDQPGYSNPAIAPGDRILKVDDMFAEHVSVETLHSMLLGDASTPVKLSLARPSGAEYVVTIMRHALHAFDTVAAAPLDGGAGGVSAGKPQWEASRKEWKREEVQTETWQAALPPVESRSGNTSQEDPSATVHFGARTSHHVTRAAPPLAAATAGAFEGPGDEANHNGSWRSTASKPPVTRAARAPSQDWKDYCRKKQAIAIAPPAKSPSHASIEKSSSGEQGKPSKALLYTAAYAFAVSTICALLILTSTVEIHGDQPVFPPSSPSVTSITSAFHHLQAPLVALETSLAAATAAEAVEAATNRVAKSLTETTSLPMDPDPVQSPVLDDGLKKGVEFREFGAKGKELENNAHKEDGGLGEANEQQQEDRPLEHSQQDASQGASDAKEDAKLRNEVMDSPSHDTVGQVGTEAEEEL